MSLNGVVAACNQKSNRSPLMQLEPDQVEESLDRLREFGAVALVEGSGRVQKYRHYLYEWLGVSKVELSVMIELLLRGPQTEGELRGRVSRMDPIDDLNALRELLTSLQTKGLVIPLTPEGRGQVFTHALFPQRDLDHQKAQHSQQSFVSSPVEDEASPRHRLHPRPPAADPRCSRAMTPARIPEDRGLAAADGRAVAIAGEAATAGNRRTQRGVFDRIEEEFQDLRRALGG